MLLTGAALFEAIQQTIRGSRALCAVAFWGSGAEQLFLGPPDRDLRIICNLAMGGTNPYVIQRLLEAGVEVRQCDALHAKVYIGTTDAVITSANASTNGLGLGAEAGWIETGCIIPAKAAVPWFEGLWDRSDEIEVPADINAALVRFIREAKIRKDNIAIGVVTPGGEQEEDLSEVYHGVSVTQAISLVLSVYQRPMTVPEIAAELEAGGLRTAAERFTDSISNAIGRGIVRGIFGRAGHARWGLMEWPGIDSGARVVSTSQIACPSPGCIRIGRIVHPMACSRVWRDRLLGCRYPPKNARRNAGSPAQDLENVCRRMHDHASGVLQLLVRPARDRFDRPVVEIRSDPHSPFGSSGQIDSSCEIGIFACDDAI